VTYKNCVNCKHRAYDTFGRAHVCVNADSEYVADFVTDEDYCEWHEEKVVGKTLNVDDFKKWLEEQRKGVNANPEVYECAEEIIKQLNIIENYLEDNGMEIDMLKLYNGNDKEGLE
jgi:hypothetical protein